ncbi:MAG: MMPL family transporter [Gammaproteobacteria bacterium]|nr:MMPL family transporter [Gammaproteobacteria bacterium]NND60306.1 MMPL family transporter [Gammaproteobacteria bacterium]
MSYVSFGEAYKQKLIKRARQLMPAWDLIAKVSYRKPAAIVIGVCLVLFAFGVWKGAEVKVGDLHQGVPELRADSRYNVDTEIITDRFSIGVDILTVIVETQPEGCIDYEVMSSIDDFAWYMANVPGVQSVVTLPRIAKIVNAGWNEGTLKWRVLSRNSDNLVQSISSIDTSSGLLNADCSVMPVMMFTEDHKAETIETIVQAVKDYRDVYDGELITLRLATGNVGVMAATNEEVEAAQFPILLGVFSAVILLCMMTFATARATLAFIVPAAVAAAIAWFVPQGRTIVAVLMLLYTLFWLVRFPSSRSVLCIIMPLGLVSLLAYALMAMLEIGLKVSTLPVVALGVGIGVDYGIYIYSRFKGFLSDGLSVHDAYHSTLRVTGAGVIFTGITLGIGVVTWILSPLKFQADMGLLLTFMFVVNMLGAILLLPALASWLLPRRMHNQS